MVEPNSVNFLQDKPAVKEGQDITEAALDAFGQLLMIWVRDEAIADWDDIVGGTAVGRTAARYPEMSRLFNEEQLRVLYQLISQVVDTTLGHLMWKVEEVEWLDISVHTERGTVPSLREASIDGVEGDFLGWIERFSKQRYMRSRSESDLHSQQETEAGGGEQ